MSEQKITLYWCRKHKYYFAQNCPDCMAETVEEETRAKTARSIIEEIEGKAERVTYHNVPIGILQAEDWQALKEKWLGKR